jgi:hypothetical protein
VAAQLGLVVELFDQLGFEAEGNSWGDWHRCSWSTDGSAVSVSAVPTLGGGCATTVNVCVRRQRLLGATD